MWQHIITIAIFLAIPKLWAAEGKISVPSDELLTLKDDWKIEKVQLNLNKRGQWQETHSEEQKIAVDTPVTGHVDSGKIIARYTKTLEFNENKGNLILWLPNPLGHVTVFANNKKIFEHGYTNQDGKRIRRGDAFIELPASKKINIRVDVDNSAYQVRGSGFYIAPLLGTYTTVLGTHSKHVHRDMFILGLLFITMVYHLLLFLLRRENVSTLIFAGYAFIIGTRMLFASEGRLLLNNDLIHPLGTYVLENFLGAIGTVIMAYFPATVLRSEKLWKIKFGYRTSLISIVLGAIASVTTLVPIPEISDIGMHLMQLNIVIMLALIIPWLVLAAVRRQPQAHLILLGYLSPGITAIVDITFYFMNIDIQTVQWGMSLFICFQAGMLSIRFNNLFDEVDDLNENLEQKVVDKTRDIRSTLDNIPQGVFRIIGNEEALRIDDEYSHGLAEILGHEDVAGRDPFTVIFENTNMSSVDRSSLKAVISGSLGEDILQFESNTHLLPNEFKIEDKIIEVDWAPIVNDDDEVNKMLCILKDVTSLRDLQEKAMKEAENAVLITEIARVRSFKKVDEFLISAEGYLDSAQEAIGRKEIIYRNLHTLKGLALTFNFQRISDLTHDAESFIQEIDATEIKNHKAEINQKIAKIFDAVGSYREVLDQLFGNDAGSVSVSKEDLVTVKDLVNSGNISTAMRKIVFLYENNVSKILETEIQSIKSLAVRLEKEPPEVQILNDNFVLDEPTANVIKKSFIHLLRNSMDHGIETASERIKKGKPGFGTISISVTYDDNKLTIAYKDDGRGLDIAGLRNKANSFGIDPNASPAELAELIFQSGLSTAKKVTDISGRGVGMEAVKKFIEIEGGEVHILIERIVNDRAMFIINIELPFRPQKTEQIAM